MTTASPSPLLSVENVKAFYGPLAVLKGISIHVDPGEIVTLIGANGAGKSTLMMTLFGRPRAREGRVVFDGQDITRKPTHDIARAGLSQVPEGRRIFPRMSVYENLQMGALPGSGTFAQDLDRVMTLFPWLRARAQQYAGTLSGGEQQMLAIGRALMSRPKLLLLDEPSLGLAPLIAKHIFSVVAQLNREDGLTVFFVEQQAYQALRLAHRAYVMVNGEITLDGSGAELLARDDFRAAYLGGAA